MRPFVIEIEFDLPFRRADGREVAPLDGVQISYLMLVDLNAI